MSRSHLQKPALLAASIILCCAGAWICNGLLQLHDGVPAASISASRLIGHLCHSDAEEISGCVASAQSAWSEVRLPIPGQPPYVPVAFLGFAYFIFLGVWYAFAGDDTPLWRQFKWLPVAVAVVGIYASLFFLSLMLMRRAPWCGGCVAVHTINFVLVVSIFLRRYLAGRTQGSIEPIGHRQVAAVLAFYFLLIATLYVSRGRRLALRDQVEDLQPYQRIVEDLQKNSTLMMDAYLNEPKRAIELRQDEIDATKEHALVVFLDYECPACLNMTAFIHDEIEKDFGGKLNVVIRHYPLCKTCNPSIPKTIHPDACGAAYAAEAARALGGRAAFDRMSDALFANQASLGSGIYRDLAVQAGIDPDKLLLRSQDAQVQDRVARDIAEAHTLGVTNTPTLFLDGRRVPQICLSPNFWKFVGTKAIAELAKAR